MGITRIANVTGLDRIGLPIVMVCRPNARSISVSQGKGIDLVAAKVSGFMEAVECFHAEHAMEPLKFASLDEMLQMHEVAEVASLPKNRLSRFHADLRLHWIEGKDIIKNKAVWLPYELVHTDYAYPSLPGSGCFTCGSTGLASGNHVLEAALHGLCEVIERDALTLWKLRAPQERIASRINLDTVTDSVCCDIIERIEHALLHVTVWDITSDCRVPVFLCRLVDPDVTTRGHSPAASFGSGCHPARNIGILRALTEAAQARLTQITGSRDDLALSFYTLTDSDYPKAVSLPCREPYLGKNFSDTAHLSTESFEGDIGSILTRLQQIGIKSVILTSLTREDFKIPVVKVVVPGLEPPHDSSSYSLGTRAQRILEQYQ